MKALTVKAIEAAQPTAKRRYIPDLACGGLVLVVQPTGVKSWAWRKKVGAATQKLTLGRFPAHGLADARRWAFELTRQRDLGIDPRAAQRAALASHDAEAARAAMTVNAAFALYMGNEGSAKRTAAEKRRMQELNVAPVIGNRLLDEITHGELAEIILAKFKTAPTASNRLRTHIRRFFRWCVTTGRDETGLTVNPASDLVAKHVEVIRDRHLGDYEIGLFMKALHDLDPRFARPFWLLLLTGSRRGEVLMMTWDELDLAKRELLIPGARSKNKHAHLVPLAPMALKIINDTPRSNSSRLCFPSLRNDEKSVSGLSKAHNRLRARMEELAALDGRTVPHWRLHDLRHTFSTGLNGLGVQPNVVEALLNHVSGSLAGVAGRYNHYAYRVEKAAALKRWETHLTRLKIK